MTEPYVRHVLLAPHNDDETLFASFVILRFRPHVVVCFRSERQQAVGIDDVTRETETAAAMGILGTTWEQCPISDKAPDESALCAYLAASFVPDEVGIVFAPLHEEGGHEQHNLVADVAARAFPGKQIVRYTTYRRGWPVTRTRTPIPFDPTWPALKLRALACYQSQISLPDTAPWFLDNGLREFYSGDYAGDAVEQPGWPAGTLR